MPASPNQRIIGCDPGAGGALAIINPADWGIAIVDTPNRIVKVSGKDRKEVDPQRFSRLLRDVDTRILVSEKLSSRPYQDCKANFSLGRFYGQIEMGAAMLDVTHLTPTPQEWKRRMMVTSDKDTSRQRAIQLIPCIAPYLARKSDHDRAEAALLALFGCFFLGLVPERFHLDTSL